MGFSIEDEGENDAEGVMGLSTGDDDFNSNILTQNTAKKRLGVSRLVRYFSEK